VARGWESKSVEMQMEERAEPHRDGPNNPADASRQRELELLKLSRTRLLAELAEAVNPRMRQLKARALSHIQTRIDGFKEL
jgi:hypothetical protein